MLRQRGTIDAAATRSRLDGAVTALRREAEGAEADLFDDAVVAAVLGVAEAMEAEANALAKIERRIGKAVRRGML